MPEEMTPPRTVPEPTKEMIEAGWSSLALERRFSTTGIGRSELVQAFKDMLAAAPPPEDRLLAEAVALIDELLRSSRRFTKATDPFLESRGTDEEFDARRDVVAVRAATEVFLERLRAAQQPTGKPPAWHDGWEARSRGVVITDCEGYSESFRDGWNVCDTVMKSGVRAQQPTEEGGG